MSNLFEEIQIILHGVWQRRWVALGVAWGICLLGWLAVALVPNVYQSRARVFVQIDSVLPSTGGTPLDTQKALDQVRQTMTSAEVLARVVQNTDLGAGATSGAEIGAKVGQLRQNLSVMSQQDNLFEISTKWSDKKLSAADNARIAAQVTAGLIKAFQETSMAGGIADTSQSLKFIDQQIAMRTKELETAEQRRVDFEQGHLGSIPGGGSIASRMEAMRNELAQLDSQLMSAQSGLAGINGQLAATPVEIVTVGGVNNGGTSALAMAEGQLAAGRAQGWTDSHPDVIALRRQIEMLRKLATAGAGSTRTPNPAYMSLKSIQAERGATVSSLHARKAQVQADMNAISRKQIQEPGLAAEQDRLNRDYDAVKQQYDKLLADREGVRLAGDVKSEGGGLKFRVIDPPSMSVIPASPNRPLLLCAVLVAGIGAGIGAAFALSQLRTTYATIGRLERATGLPVIGGISDVATPGRRVQARREGRWFYAACSGLGGLCLVLLAAEFIQRGMSA